jgi:hypothetical protein
MSKSILIKKEEFNKYKVRSPVVLFIFNRPDLTRVVFEEIKKAQPSKLYVVSDGPRENIKGECDLVNESRKILHDIDWSCDVVTYFSDINLGCKASISLGIAHVFNRETDAIFLEDDCVPDSSFFRYCDELLEKYRYHESIMIVSGTSKVSRNLRKNNESYYFTRYPNLWGWASWSDKWLHHYDVEIKSWRTMKNKVLETMPNKSNQKYWKYIFEDTYLGKNDTWDYQVAYMMMLNRMLAISPFCNLVSNIGCGHVSSTHTSKYNEYAELELDQMDFPLVHPDGVLANDRIDAIESNKEHRILTIPERILKRLVRLLK